MTRTTPPRLGSPAVSALRNSQSPSVESAHEHLAARRRVGLGAGVSVVFEDRQTVWFRVQELNRYGRGADVRRQLDWYERLMPGDGRVRAAVWLTARGPRADDLRAVVGNGVLVLTSTVGHRVVGVYLTQKVTDRLIGLVGWVEFRFEADDRAALHDPLVGWRLSVQADGQTVLAGEVDEGVLESLSADVG